MKICKVDGLLTSESCQKLNCTLYNQLKSLSVSTTVFGNPGHVLCHKIKGTPVIGEYYSKTKSQWKHISFCFDKKWDDFLPIASLIKISDKNNKSL